jgi:hypothetical protein
MQWGKSFWPIAKEQRNILHTVNRRKANWIGYILRRNCLLKHVIEGKIEGTIGVMERRGRKHTPLVDKLKQTREYRKLKEEALNRTLWRNGFGRGCGPAAGQTAEWMTMRDRVCVKPKAVDSVCTLWSYGHVTAGTFRVRHLFAQLFPSCPVLARRSG